MHSSPDVLIYVAITFIPAVPTWIIAWCAWTGGYRRWAIKPVVFDALNGGLAFHKRNYIPLLAGVLGTTWAALFINDFLADHIYGDGTAETSAVIAICGVSLVLLVWWTPFLTPRWHKEWLERSGRRELPSQTPRAIRRTARDQEARTSETAGQVAEAHPEETGERRPMTHESAPAAGDAPMHRVLSCQPQPRLGDRAILRYWRRQNDQIAADRDAALGSINPFT